MQIYNNKHCCQCGECFKEDDDVAVCPECGTPVHRSCWTGECPNADKHSEGYEWKEEIRAENDEKKECCRNCGAGTDKNMMFCPQCGMPLSKQTFDNQGGYGGAFMEDDPAVISFSSFEDFADKLEKRPIRDRETGEELTCYGVRQKELIRFFGRKHFSTSRFLTLFLQMANTGKKVSFNFCAGFFMPYYQFYRRVTGPGIIVLLVNFILSLPYTVYQLGFFREYMTGSGSEAALSTEISTLINTFSVISFIIEVGLILFWDYFYMKWSVGKILSMREEYADAPEEEYLEALEKTGRPSWGGALIALVIMFALSSVVVYLFGAGLI